MPSILDGIPKSAAEFAQVMALSETITDALLEERASPGQKQVAALLKQGVPMATIAGLSDDELDAILATGLEQLQAGAFKAAREVLMGLVKLKPLDFRFLYALGVAQQGLEDPVAAGRTYVQAAILDATNPQCYLRLGECLLANGETENARGSFAVAQALVRDGHGTREAGAHADRMLAALPQEPVAA